MLVVDYGIAQPLGVGTQRYQHARACLYSSYILWRLSLEAGRSNMQVCRIVIGFIISTLITKYNLLSYCDTRLTLRVIHVCGILI